MWTLTTTKCSGSYNLPQDMRIYIFPTKSHKTALFIYSMVDQNLTGKNIFQSSCVSTHYFWCIEAIDCPNPTPNTLTFNQIWSA